MPPPPNPLDLPYPVDYHYYETWDPKQDNHPLEPASVEAYNYPGGLPSVPHRKDLVIKRANGERVWAPHKCIKCGAPASTAVLFIRGYSNSGDTGIQPDGYRLFEMCPHCRRTTSWPYLGIAPSGWKAPALPQHMWRKDVQRPAVYRWERALAQHYPFLTDTLDWETTTAYVRTLFRSFGLTPPAIHRGKGRQSWMRDMHTMSLTDWGQSRWILIHEAAHAIDLHLRKPMKWDSKGAGHGPSYVATYMALLVEFGQVPEDTLLTTASAHKLRWHDLPTTLAHIRRVIKPDHAEAFRQGRCHYGQL